MKYLTRANPKSLRGTALVRLDFNTEDAWRMRAAIPTIQFLLQCWAKVVIVSHRGRPKGFERKLSLRKDGITLAKMLGRPVRFIPHFRFRTIHKDIARAPAKSVFLLENIRFLKSEATKRPELAKKLASLADYYVNDAFAVDHHPADSVVGVAKFLPAYAGLELEKEINTLSGAMRHPKHPLVVVLGGAKAHDKLGVINRFKRRAKYFLLGGVGANTMLMLRGFDVKKSHVERDPKDIRELKKVMHAHNIVVPIDCRVKNKAIVDIGPKTAKLYAQKIGVARTIIWSGPMGKIEKRHYDIGTLAVARAIAANKKAFSVTGGGETVLFLKKHHLDKKFSFISTGGGAMLAFLAGEKLPGIAALEKQGRASPILKNGREAFKKNKRKTK